MRGSADMKAFFIGILILGGMMPFLLQAQGAWDIGYVNCRSIEAKHIGQSFKPDFLPRCKERGRANKSYRYALSRPDEVTLNVGDASVRFVEYRNIHDDWGLYAEQYLVSLSPNNDQQEVRIQEMTLQEIRSRSFQFAATVQYVRLGSGEGEVVRTETLAITIKKRKLQGLMYLKQAGR